MFERAYLDIQRVLDGAHGGEVGAGAGAGIVEDVQLVVEQRDLYQVERDEARAEVVRLGKALEAARIIADQAVSNAHREAGTW